MGLVNWGPSKSYLKQLPNHKNRTMVNQNFQVVSAWLSILIEGKSTESTKQKKKKETKTPILTY